MAVASASKTKRLHQGQKFESILNINPFISLRADRVAANRAIWIASRMSALSQWVSPNARLLWALTKLFGQTCR
jgi:hypothetical protein